MNRQNGNTLIVVLLVLIAALMAAGIGFMYWDSQKKEQTARLEKAIAYFDKLELEEKQAAEAERQKQEQAKVLAEQEKMRIALEKAKIDAERSLAQNIAAAKQKSNEHAKNDECKHVYAGKYYETSRLQQGFFKNYYVSVKWTVVGFSSRTGRATVREGDGGGLIEVNCSSIP